MWQILEYTGYLFARIILIIIAIISFITFQLFGDDSHERIGSFETNDQLPIVRLSDFTEREPYRATPNKKPSLHIGQRKLFMNELQFIHKYKPDIVVYAGAAPSMHIWRLHELFPKTKFLLVDPNEFCIIKRNGVTHYDEPAGVEYLQVGNDRKDYYKGKQMVMYQNKLVDKETIRRGDDVPFEGELTLNRPISLIENLFTIDIANKVAELAKTHKLAFWSDIRTNFVSEDHPTELDICINSAQQLTWVDIIQPAVTMLKFRCPFFGNVKDISADFHLPDYANEYLEYCKSKYGIDFLQDYSNHKFRYIDGECFIQPWARESSAESRLVFTTIKIKNYDSQEYEDKFFYYNNTLRLKKYNHHKIDKKHCIDRCGDCALEASIWSDFTKDVLENMVSLGQYMGPHGRSLCASKHGMNY